MNPSVMWQRRKGLSKSSQAENGDIPLSTQSLVRDEEQHSSPSKTEKTDSPQKTTEKRRRVELYVSGRRFVTYNTTLSRIPCSRLAELSPDDEEYDEETNTYFFDRNPYIFTFVLSAYQSGALHLPHCLCSQSVKIELQYWRLRVDLLAPCCWKKYCEYEEEVDALSQLETAMIREKTLQQQRKLTNKQSSRWTKFKANTYLFLEEPKSSKAAKYWSWVYIGMLLASATMMVISTMEVCRVPSNRRIQQNATNNGGNSNVTRKEETGNDTPGKTRLFFETDEHPVVRVLSIILMMFFMAELVLRFIVWPRKRRFLCQFFNIIDVLSITPLFITYTSSLIDPDIWINTSIFGSFMIVGFANVFRTLRILKLIKHNRDLRVMILALRASLHEMMLLLLLMAIGMLIFSTSIYYAEFMRQDAFRSIPEGFWWSVITITTVGYGDLYPTSEFGHVVGALCALSGMLITGLPIPIIANNFNLYYSFAKMDDNIAQRTKHKLEKRQMKGLRESLEAIQASQEQLTQEQLAEEAVAL